MTKEHLEIRLKHVNDNLNICLERIHQYEVELTDEDDPNLQSKYKRRIDKLEKSVAEYDKEYEKLKTLWSGLSVSEANSLASDFQQATTGLVDVKHDLETLLAKVAAMAVEPNHLSEGEMRDALEKIRNALSALPQGESYSSERSQLQEVLDDTSLDVKHRLKLSIPIIPLLLSYETEVGVSATDNLGKIWIWLKSKLLK